MFIQRAFATKDITRLDELLAQNPFVTLVTSDDDGLPLATQLPVIYRRTGDTVQIEGHFARPNPQAQHAGRPALIIVQGAHSYISASWYPDKIEQARVPTWNYSTAHLVGTLELIEDEAALCAHLAELAEYFESRNGSDWRFDAGNPAERIQVRGLIGFRIKASCIDIKDKLNQNHPRANRQAVAAALAAKPCENAQEIARLMQTTLQGETDAT